MGQLRTQWWLANKKVKFRLSIGELPTRKRNGTKDRCRIKQSLEENAKPDWEGKHYGKRDNQSQMVMYQSPKMASMCTINGRNTTYNA